MIEVPKNSAHLVSPRTGVMLPLLLCALVLLTACQSAPTRHLQNSAGWQEIALPSRGARILEITPVDGGVLALGSVPVSGGRAPSAWTTSDAASWHRIDVTPATGYGAQAEFIMGAAVGGKVSAFGQAYGGAHSNPRPTLWSGGLGSNGEK